MVYNIIFLKINPNKIFRFLFYLLPDLIPIPLHCHLIFPIIFSYYQYFAFTLGISYPNQNQIVYRNFIYLHLTIIHYYFQKPMYCP